MTIVPSSDQRIVLSCARCKQETSQMTQAELDQFGTPWYCQRCGAQMTAFKVGIPDELSEASMRDLMRQLRVDLIKSGALYDSVDGRVARTATLSRFRKKPNN